MVIAEILALSPADTATDLAIKVGSVAKWLQTIGFIVVIWIIATLMHWIMDRKKLLRINSIKKDLERIEKKIDKLSKKK